MERVEEMLIDSLRNLLPNYSGEKILVAVSGGVDSMVCAHVLKKYNYPITIAHCNFQLRKKDADADAAFVKKWATKKEVPHIEKKFKVKKVKGESVQMTARDLRYKWFYEVAAKKGFGYIITAHHLNDSIETSLMNMIRGTGITGLTGIPAINGKIVRPMNHLYREEIETYARKHKIAWREDKTNITTKYKRNKIRHELIPLLEQYNPNFIETYAFNIFNWQNVARVYRQAIGRLKTELVHFDEGMGGFKISVLELLGRGINEEIMYELVSEFGYNADQAAQIIEAIHAQPGKKFYSKDHILLIDRLYLLIKPVDETYQIQEEYTIKNDQLPYANEEWEVGTVAAKKLPTLLTGSNEILLDHKTLQFPIKIRKWKAGDKFTPMGMKGKKKLSDFFTDLKVDQFKKEDTFVVESSNKKIAGVIGFRPDENHKISKTTQLCLYIKRKNLYF
jgi:tRNA(Ile)-lysidine synthase